jgi:hypothetical protein
VGLSRSLQATSRKSVVTNPSAALNIGSADSPRYRATNMEVIELDTGKFGFFNFLTNVIHIWINVLLLMCSNTDFGSSFSGVLTDEQGRVQALWASFSTQVLTSYSFACLPGWIWSFFIASFFIIK